MFLMNARVTLIAALHFFYLKMDLVLQWNMSFSKQKTRRFSMGSSIEADYTAMPNYLIMQI